MMLSARFAARELRAGVRGFRIFLACLALGVAAIAAASSTAEAFRHGLASQAREILGGDLAVSVRQRHFTPAERTRMVKLAMNDLIAQRWEPLVASLLPPGFTVLDQSEIPARNRRQMLASRDHVPKGARNDV